MAKKIVSKETESESATSKISKNSNAKIQKKKDPIPNLNENLAGKLNRKPIENTNKRTDSSAKVSIQIGTKKREIKTSNGKVIVQFVGSKTMKSKDGIKLNQKKLKDSFCFSLEEIRGMKIETPIQISDPSNSSNILPGAVFSGEKLINSGKFVYQKMKMRKPVNLRIPPSNLVKNTMAKATPTSGEDLTGKLGNATNSLITASNFHSGAAPNKEAELNTIATTVEDYVSLNIATSGFFLGISGENNFRFSSKEKMYNYLFSFEQKCVDVIADQIHSPSDVFTDEKGWDTDWFYIEQVEYGRKLHILINSYKKLESFMGKQAGELNWGIVGGKFSIEEEGSHLFEEISIKAMALGGAPFTETNPKKLDAAIKKYFSVPYTNYNIVPLSFTITNLHGSPVSLITEAFLDEKNCLESTIVRVKIKKIEVLTADDGASDASEQLFGKIPIFLYNEKKKLVAADGKTEIKKINNLPQFPSAFISYGSEDSPLRVVSKKPIDENSSILKNKFVDLNIQNLDYQIEFRPVMKEEDDFTDDVFKNQSGNFKMSIRDMLLESVFTKTYFFNDGKSEVELTMEISPL